jgi:hypothetical protein
VIAEETDGGLADGLKSRTSMAEAEELNSLLVNKLLVPLSNSMMFDIENLNRRQAAAVLCYYLDSSPAVQDSVKLLIKNLKDRDVVKYLEVQMVALKGVYTLQVISHLREKQQMEEEGEFDEDIETEQEVSNKISEGYETTISLAKRLVSTMGVGKLKGDALHATVNFFRAGIDVCFAQPLHTGFTKIIEQYLRLLPPPNVKIIAEYFECKVEKAEDLAELFEDSDAKGDKELESLLDFRSLLSGRMRVKRKETSYIEDDNSSQGSPSQALVYKSKVGRYKGQKVAVKNDQTKAGSHAVGKGKRKHSILESVHEDYDSEKKEDQEEVVAVKALKTVKPKQQREKAVPKADTLAARRSSRGDTTKKFNYDDEREDLDGHDNSKEGDDSLDEGETGQQGSKRRGQVSPSVKRRPTLSKGNKKFTQEESEEEEQEEEEVEEDDVTSSKFGSFKGASHSPPAKLATYSSATKSFQEKALLSKGSKPSAVQEEDEDEGVNQTLKLGLELEDNQEWIIDQEDGVEDGGLDEEAFNMDANYARKRGREPEPINAKPTGKECKMNITTVQTLTSTKTLTLSLA